MLKRLSKVTGNINIHGHMSIWQLTEFASLNEKQFLKF